MCRLIKSKFSRTCSVRSGPSLVTSSLYLTLSNKPTNVWPFPNRGEGFIHELHSTLWAHLGTHSGRCHLCPLSRCRSAAIGCFRPTITSAGAQFVRVGLLCNLTINRITHTHAWYGVCPRYARLKAG